MRPKRVFKGSWGSVDLQVGVPAEVVERIRCSAAYRVIGRILFYRELGFPLEEIVTILSDREAGGADHLRRQHRMLSRRIEHLKSMVAALEYEMEAQQMGISLTLEERIEIFGDFLPEDYEEEAEQRWGGTDAWKQSQRKAAAMTRQDWLEVKEQSADIERRLVATMHGGVPADSSVAMDLAEEHRQQITKWFYECSYEIHSGLGRMFVEDPRFKSRFDGIAPGLAEFSRDAFAANAARAGG